VAPREYEFFVHDKEFPYASPNCGCGGWVCVVFDVRFLNCL
jgi:hypothetical protein